jgi:hypothetical protein
MRIFASLAIAATLACGVFACSAAPDESAEPSAPSGEQDLTTVSADLLGSWTIDDSTAGVGTTIAYDFRPNGAFFRDSNRVLNGIFLPGAPHPVLRETGTYSVDPVARRITLHVAGSQAVLAHTEVLAYAYKPVVMNGVFLPGHAPKPTLTLTRQPAPMSQIAFPSITYDKADSWCTSVQDCDAELADQTWWPNGVGAVSCDTNKRVCVP